MARELSNSVCLSWIMSVIVFLHSFSSCSASVPEDLSELLALLCELTEYKSNTVCFGRAHPQPTAYVVTPKLWNHYQNIDYISVSLTEEKSRRTESKEILWAGTSLSCVFWPRSGSELRTVVGRREKMWSHGRSESPGWRERWPMKMETTSVLSLRGALEILH